jgi:hypothetical protein
MCVSVYEKYSIYRRPTVNTVLGIGASVYEKNGAYIDVSLYMSTGQGICASVCMKKM